MAKIRKLAGRHFIDEKGKIFWINGPDNNCYIAEQMVWREGLRFAEVLEWKQCAPTGRVSQRFGSIDQALQAFERDGIDWSTDLYLQKVGEQMLAQRSVDDYKPTAMKEAEAQGAPVKRAPWSAAQDSGT